MSKIAEKIIDQLRADAFSFVGYATTIETMDADLKRSIDRALEGKIIKKSEVDGLRREVLYYYTNWCDLSQQLAAAEQKIKDLQEREVILIATCKSNLNNWLKAEAREQAATQELATYKQAEEVESRLDAVEPGVIFAGPIDWSPSYTYSYTYGNSNPVPITWSWRGEPHTSADPFSSTDKSFMGRANKSESQPLTWWQQIKNTLREFTN